MPLCAGVGEGAADELAFELLIPKLILQRYVNLLLEHRRVILSGSTGTGKTYLARRLAESVVERCVIHSFVVFIATERNCVLQIMHNNNSSNSSSRFV